ncbi:hypothetical protein [Fluviibacter phosphoraccumulans]|uniref:hypothetical protein n=1 Tax=Fluviibacter phosphoraccumulans TaxID=1751046 RepID=UPI0024E1C003|nr:hypothetical protein [Fluviibacter phosphoraccumulans]
MDDWRSRWKGRTTITVADFILLTFDIDPATVEQQPASGYRTEQILDAIQHSGLASGLGYDQPVHKLLRPTTGRQAENELREHATNRLLYFKDAVAFAVECGQWEIPEWLQATYRGTTVPFEKHRKISTELPVQITSTETNASKQPAPPSCPVPRDSSLITTIAALMAAWPGGTPPSGKELEKAAQSLGLTISDDTIRKVLSAAREIAPTLRQPR